MKMKKSGFTLIELILVVVVIGILASMAAGSNVQRKKMAEYKSALVNIQVIAAAEKNYFLAMDDYANTFGGTSNLNDALGAKIFDGYFFNYKVTKISTTPPSFTILVETLQNTYPEITHTFFIFDSNATRIDCFTSPADASASDCWL